MGIKLNVHDFDSELVAKLIEEDVGEPVKIVETKGIVGNRIDPGAEIVAVTLPRLYCNHCERYLDEEEARKTDKLGATIYSCPNCGERINPFDLSIMYLSYEVKREEGELLFNAKIAKEIPAGLYQIFD